MQNIFLCSILYRVLLRAAEYDDGETQKAALLVLCNCVCSTKQKVNYCVYQTVGMLLEMLYVMYIISPTAGLKHSLMFLKPNIILPYHSNLLLDGCLIFLQTKGKRSHSVKADDVQQRLWNCVRANNGIRVLLSLILVKTPLSHADSIRALACRALCGLARSDEIRQIMSKLPMVHSGQLQRK
jgi:hypothetical protein